MTNDDLPRPKPNPLRDLMREDLDPLSTVEVRERIEALRQEIARCERRLQQSGSVRSAADALFRRG